MPLPPKILVVADPAQQHELVGALRAGGEPLADAVIAVGDGDDDTLQQFAALRPAVVVIAATLDGGDARALIGAMREAALAAGGGVFIVLLGDERGPVKNALDALELGCDRFVGRPVAAKALRFAVVSGLAATPGATPARPRPATAPERRSMVRAETIDPAAPDASADTGETAPVRIEDLPTRPVSSLRARWEALADAIGTGDGLGDDDDDDEAVDDDATDARALDDDLDPDLDDGPGLHLDEQVVVVARPPTAPIEDGWRPGSTEVPAVPLREPTMVLGDEPPPAAAPVTPPPAIELVERNHDDASAWGNASHVSAADDEDDVLADVAEGLDDDLSVDLTRDPAPMTTPPPAPVVELGGPPAGGDFARELRRKMSLMAERLFRGEVPAPVTIGPGHDHHTEIDLGGLVEEPRLGHSEVYDGGGATFVGGTEDPASRTQATESRGTAEAGEIQRGVSDAAALIARMFTSDFTGRIVFRRGPVEKVIHFEGGRPVFASSSLAHDRMGELLLREGKITSEQYARCRDLVRDTGRRMGEILVERGFLKRRELLPAVRRHVEDIIYSLFAWDQGEYRVVAGDGATAERIRLSRHPAAMVLEGVRRKLDGAALERLLGPPGTVVETTDRDKLAAITGVADLSAEERAALGALDGSTDLATIARQSGAALANVYQLAWSLHLLGLAATRRRPGDEDGEAPTLVGESDLAIDRERVRARHRLVADADYFALLGVRRDATGFEIKRAYEAARRDFASETFPPELRKELHAELDEIAHVLDEAYRVLRDDLLRGNYLRHLRDFIEEAS